jgi:hypothetical protein
MNNTKSEIDKSTDRIAGQLQRSGDGTNRQSAFAVLVGAVRKYMNTATAL